ncbi:MAG TPA: UDP-4-amino-4,6-dideoxy-N-acetyl-beta-L-altrosamine transaminase [Stellaceae bacterium]|nr:UDP-4-amino-4,6-dideoxy-N-acetyl-beta-L-altrosamine transaminase [Stellaceae bacterium]
MIAPPILPYGRHAIDQDDIDAVVNVLRGDWLTTGPIVTQFERALADYCGANDAVSCANGTAALHLACLALGLGPEDTVIVPSITFVASANAARLVGAEIVFADVDPDTGLMDASHLADAIERATRQGRRPSATVPVHLGGQCSDLAALGRLAAQHDISVIEDACHAIGTRYVRGNGPTVAIGSCADSALTVFSFHPVKTITAGEGGAVTANDADLARRLRQWRGHGIEREPSAFLNRQAGFEGDTPNPWYYEMPEIGLNYRLSDINAALALNQLGKLDRFAAARRALAERYDRRLAALGPLVRPIGRASGCEPGWHLYAVLIDFAALDITRGEVMRALRARGIGSQVHYIPVHRQPYYRQRYGDTVLPGAEAYYRRTLSLPLYVGMTVSDVDRVVDALAKTLVR